MKLVVIGGGNMGHTYATSIGKAIKEIDISILESYSPKVEELRKEAKFEIYNTPSECIPGADIIMLAVKPQQSADLFSNIRPLVNPKQMIISIMAGATIETIQKSLGINKVVRAMPNLPAQIGKGMTAYCPDRSISQEDLNIVQDVLSSTGKAIQVNNENAIDASTGISGSGPAYVFYFMQAMMQAATELGFDEQESKELVCQTFDGAVSLFQENNLNTQEWMNRVASKGGTTRAALDSFESNNVGQHIKEGAIAAYTRAVELGRMK